MNRLLREFRLVPVVLFATVTLLALKVGGLITGGGYTLGTPRAAQAQGAPAKRSWAQEVLGYPDVTGSVDKPKPADANGSAKDANGAGKDADGSAKGDGEKPAAAAAAAAAAPAAGAPPAAAGKPVVIEGTRTMSPAERAVLERLQERRQELDQRAREMDIREGLLAAAEKRIEARLNEVRDIEARINAATAKKDEAEIARFKGVVTMYENMKAKDAARIFDRLDMRVLLEVASQMNPRRMSDILAQMQPQAAERLTVELATRSHEVNPVEKPPAVTDLPKIEGRPGG
jgi:flagellar motility protein MotE (MotC chaperone)